MKIHVEFDQPIVEIEIDTIYSKSHPGVQLTATYSNGAKETRLFRKGETWKINMNAVDMDVEPSKLLRELSNHV